MPKKKPIEAGAVFGLLRVICPTGERADNRCDMYLCSCECGKSREVDSSTLRMGRAYSCGCRSRPKRRIPMKHGHSKRIGHSRTYQTWAAMKQRCDNPNNPKYPTYGGRGIRICDRWRSFGAFLEDMGERPNGMTIERVDVNGDYEPRNCIWGSPEAQANNKTNNRIIEFAGKKQTAAMWAKELGLSHVVLRMRLHRGWSIGRALTEGVKQ